MNCKEDYGMTMSKENSHTWRRTTLSATVFVWPRSG